MSFYSLTSYSQLRVNQTALGGGTPTPPSFADTKSFQFDGITDRFIGVGTYTELDGQNNFAFSFWIKPSTLLGTRIILSIGNGQADSRAQQFFVSSSGGRLYIYLSTMSYYGYSNISLTQDVWQHVLVTRDATRAINDKIRIYINGVNELSYETTRYWTNTTNATTGLMIGEHTNSYGGSFLGNIDELAIYTEDMASYISEIYNGGLPNDLNNLPTAPQPTTWQRMGEDVLWNGFAFTMTDVNGGYVNRGIGLNASDPNPTTDVPLFDNKSFTYDGVSDYVSLGSRTQNFTDFTISVWFKTQPKGGLNAIIGNSGAEGGYLFFIGQASGVIKFVDDAYRTISGVITDDVWHHLAVTYDSSANELKSYVDNVLFTTYTPVASTLPTNSHSFNQLGQRTSVGQWLGNINDLSVFSNVLSSSDVTTIFNGGVPNNISALSPIHYWRAEQVTFDGTDWTLIDQGSGGNNGTSVSMPLTARTSDVPLFDNKSFTYDGVSDAVVIGTASLGITNAISVSAWVKIPTTNTGGGGTNIQVIIAEDPTSSGQRNWNLFWRGGGIDSFYFVVHNTNLSTAAAQSVGVTPNSGQWIHILATYDGTANANGIKLYIDGVLNAQGTASSTGINSFTSSEPNIGRLTGQNQWNFEGNINDVSVFNTDESSNASTIYNGGIANDISNLNPLSYWRSEFATWDGSNWTMIDQGSGANNGTSVSMPLTSRTSDVPT